MADTRRKNGYRAGGSVFGVTAGYKKVMEKGEWVVKTHGKRVLQVVSMTSATCFLTSRAGIEYA